MTTYTIKAPNGVTYEIEGPEGASQEQVARAVLAKNPEAAKPAVPKSGVGAAVQSGFDSLLSSGAAGLESVFGDATAAGKRANARDTERAGRFADQTGLDKLGAAYDKDGLYGGAKEVLRQAPLVLAEQVPNIAEMTAGARLGAIAGTAAVPLVGPAGPLVGGALGAFAPAAVHQLGSMVARQTAEKPDAPVDMSKAVPAALLGGGIDVASTFIPQGKTLVGKLLGPRVEALLAKNTAESLKAAEKLASEKLMPTLGKGLAVGAGVAIPGEVTQQLLERWQAGKDLFSTDALKEYADTAYQTGLLAPLGAAGRFADRGAARVEVAEKAKADKIAAAQAAQAAAAQQAAQDLAAGQARANEAPNVGPQLSDLKADIGSPGQALPPRPMATAAQPDMFGAADQPNAPAEPEAVDPVLRKQELTQQMRTLADTLEEQRAAVADATSPEESIAAARLFKQTEAALAQAQQAQAAIKIEATPDEKLARAFSSWQKAKEQGDVDQAAKFAERIVELKAAGAAVPGAAPQTQTAMSLRKQQNSTEDTDSFNQRVVGPEIAAGREQAAAQRQRVDEEVARTRELGKENDLPYVSQARGERQNQLTVEGMEANRLDTAKTDQRTLFDEVTPAPRFVDSDATYNKKRTALIQELQRARRDKDQKAAATAVDALRALQDQKLTVQARMGAPKGDSVAPPQLGENVFTGAAKPGTATAAVESTPTRKTDTEADLRQQLAQLPTELTPEVEALAQRIQRSLPAIAMNPQRAADTSDWLYSVRTGNPKDATALTQQLDTLDQGRLQDNGQKDALPQEQYQGKLYSTPEAFQKYMGSEALNKLRIMLGSTAQTVQRAMKKIVPLQKRIDQLTDSIAAERDKYERTKQYGEVMAADADAKHAAAQARFDDVIQRLDAELVPLQAEYLQAQTALKEATEYAKDINETIAANRAVAGPAAIQKIKFFQAKLVEELKAVQELSVAFVNAKADLERVAKNQKQRVTTQRAINDAAGETFDAAKERADTVQGTRAALRENQEGRQAMRAERSDIERQVDDIMRPVNEARDARAAVDPPTYEAKRTPEDTEESKRRDEAAGERSREEQARLERAEAAPGERIDNTKYRAARDAAPADTTQEQRMALLEEKSQDMSLPEPTRNKARRQFLAMEREMSTKEQRSTAQAEIDRLLDERIPALERQVREAPTDSNKQELRIARRAVQKLQALTVPASRTPLGPKTYDAEPIEPGARLRARKVGPLVKKESVAGEQRTGSTESIDGENKTGSRNKVTQSGMPRAPTPKQAVKEGNRLSEQRTVRQEMAAEKLEREQEAAAEKQSKRTKTDAAVDDIYNDGGDGDYYDPSGFGNFDGEFEAALFRTSTARGPGLKQDAVTRLVKRITDDWTNVPDVQVVATEADLPARIQAQAKADNMTGKIPGLFDPDTRTVYLVAENLHTGNDVALTIAHEVAGHYGLRDMMGDSYSDTMQRLYKGNEAIRTQADARMKASPNLSKDVAVEEVLAEMAETMSAKSGTKAELARIFHAIKSWFARTLGIRNVSDAEVRQIVANARRHVKRGTPNGPSGGPKGSVYRKAAPNYGDLDGSVLADTAGELLPERDTRSFKDKALANARLVAEMQVVDMRAPLRDALQAIATAKGNTDDFEQAMYFVRKGDQASSVTAAVLGNGFPELTKVDQKTGARVYGASGKASYVNVMDDIAALPIKGANIEGKVELATTYLALQRAKSVGFKKLDFAGNIDAKKAAAIDQALKADPALKKALDKVRATYNDYNSGLVKFLADSGAISQKTAADLLKNGDYMPYYRVDSSGMAKLYLDADHPISLGEVRHQKHLAELKGGEDRILPLNESIVRNTALLMDKASTNLSAKSVAYMLQDAGAGKIVPGKGEQGPDIIRFHQEPDPKNPEDTGDRWIKINLEGTAAEGIPAELLIKSLEGSRVMLPGILKVMSAAGDLLRAGVTRTPLYLLRQLTRDPMASSFTAGLDSGPMRSVLNAGKEFIKSSRGTSQTHADLIAKGLIQHPLFTGDRDDIAKFALQIAENRTPGPLGKLFQMADGWATQADAATRALVYENAIKNGMNPMQAEMLTMESMNFHKRGMSPSVQFANRAIPFFNAQIQGLNVLWKAMSGQMPYEEKLNIQRKFRNNAALLTVAGLSYAAAMSDDDYYKNASAKDRMTNFFLHLPGVEEPIKIPIPYEMGYFFSLGVAAIEAMRDEADGEELLRGVGAMAFGSIPGASSLFMPQLVKPALEAYTNTNFYSGRGIETASQQKLSPELRYNNSTTEMAKALSEAAPFLSPVQIEHLVKGYFGILPIAAMASANALFADDNAVDKPEGKTSDIPLLGGAFQRKVAGEDVTVAYRYVKEAEQAKSSYDYIARKGQRDAAMKYLEKNRGAVMMAPLAGKFTQTMAQLKRAEEAVRGSAQTPEAKQAAIDRIAAQRRDIADRFVKKFKEMEARGEATAA